MAFRVRRRQFAEVYPMMVTARRTRVSALSRGPLSTARKEKTMKTTLALLMAAAFMIGGCNTIAGAGKDIEAGGEAVHDTAEDVKQDM